MREIELGKIVPIVTRKTVAKKTESFDKLTVVRTEINSDGVVVAIAELPEVLVLWKTIPVEIQTLLDERLKAVLDNPAIVDEEEVKEKV